MKNSSVDEPAPGAVMVETLPFELVDTTRVNADPSVIVLINVAALPEGAELWPD